MGISQTGRPKKDELKREIRERNGTFYAYTLTSEMVNGRKITKTTYEGIWDPVTETVKPKKPRRYVHHADQQGHVMGDDDVVL